MKVKPGKANSNADFLSRQRGQEAVGDISAEFPDEFPETGTRNLEEVSAFHIHGGESEFQEVINYLTERRYPDNLTRGGKDHVPTSGSTLHTDPRSTL